MPSRPTSTWNTFSPPLTYPASPSESTLRLQVHLSIRTGSSLLTLDHVEQPSVHNNRPVGKWAIPPRLIPS